MATVLSVRDDIFQHGIGLTLALGAAVAVEIAGIKVIINSERQQVFAPNCFTDFGIDLADMRAVIVKSTQHFRATFGPLAREVIYADTPGDMTAHITADRFDNVARPIWPLDVIESI
jgi:microcystin degradation protein MlrC